MTTRAAAAAETADKILVATKQLFNENTIAEITLAAIAQRSGVTVQRHCQLEPTYLADVMMSRGLDETSCPSRRFRRRPWSSPR